MSDDPALLPNNWKHSLGKSSLCVPQSGTWFYVFSSTKAFIKEEIAASSSQFAPKLAGGSPWTLWPSWIWRPWWSCEIQVELSRWIHLRGVSIDIKLGPAESTEDFTRRCDQSKLGQEWLHSEGYIDDNYWKFRWEHSENSYAKEWSGRNIITQMRLDFATDTHTHVEEFDRRSGRVGVWA